MGCDKITTIFYIPFKVRVTMRSIKHKCIHYNINLLLLHRLKITQIKDTKYKLYSILQVCTIFSVNYLFLYWRKVYGNSLHESTRKTNLKTLSRISKTRKYNPKIPNMHQYMFQNTIYLLNCFALFLFH